MMLWSNSTCDSASKLGPLVTAIIQYAKKVGMVLPVFLPNYTTGKHLRPHLTLA